MQTVPSAYTPTVTVIPANHALVKQLNGMPKKMCVAAYCRVSTDSDEQLNSYESQVSYYTDKINSNREWKMAGIFADEGISGTRTKNRTEFLKLIDLCKKGKVDLILIKSLSRFARNTVDSLNHIRALKAMGIGIYFEKENLNTLEIDNEVILTIHSCFAQAESESISANVKWGKRQSFKEGKVSFQYSRMLGYEKGEDGKPKIMPEQAALVKRIFYEYLDGKSVEQIRQGFDNDGIASPVSKKGWSREGLKNILRNEKYIGDALLQKTYVADVLTKKTVKNNGDIPQYYVSNHHEPIIEREIFNRVQEEMARRQGKRRVAQKSVKTEQGKYSGKYALSELLYCGDCGTKYRRCTWSRNGEKKVVWRCINRLEYGTKYCKQSPTIEENRLHDAILRAVNRILANQGQYTEKLTNSLRIASVGNMGEFDAAALRKQIAEKNKAIVDMVSGMSENDIKADEIEKTAAVICAEIAEFETRLRLYEQESVRQQCENSRLNKMISELNGEQASLEQYDDTAVRRLVENVKVVDADNIVVCLRSGMEIGETLR